MPRKRGVEMLRVLLGKPAWPPLGWRTCLEPWAHFSHTRRSESCSWLEILHAPGCSFAGFYRRPPAKAPSHPPLIWRLLLPPNKSLRGRTDVSHLGSPPFLILKPSRFSPKNKEKERAEEKKRRQPWPCLELFVAPQKNGLLSPFYSCVLISGGGQYREWERTARLWSFWAASKAVPSHLYFVFIHPSTIDGVPPCAPGALCQALRTPPWANTVKPLLTRSWYSGGGDEPWALKHWWGRNSLPLQK